MVTDKVIRRKTRWANFMVDKLRLSKQKPSKIVVE